MRSINIVTLALVVGSFGCGLDRTPLLPGGSGGSAGSGGKSGAGGSGGVAGAASGGASGQTGDCDVATCGVQPMRLPRLCPDGKYVAFVCVPDPANGVCGWIDGTCPDVCPGLGCDPSCPNGVMTDANGCPTCQCNPVVCPALACATKCANGVVADANGCPTCQCNPPPTCGPVCQIYCPNGNVLDANGCPTCQCNPPPDGPCTTAECGPAPAVPSQICWDGKTTSGPVCLRDPSGVCGWHVTACPPMPSSCDKSQCPTPAPGVPSYVCPDGTVAGPACVPINGACGWTIVSCPQPPVDSCPCATPFLCVQQIGGPAVQASTPQPQLCGVPNPQCTSTDACACLDKSDGTCKSSGSPRTCVCDNGIR